MTKVYKLKSDFENYCHFQEVYKNIDETFLDKYWEWQPIDENTYEKVKLKLLEGDNRKKNYYMDVSASSGCGLIIFSEKAVKYLKEILESSGQIVPVITSSKRKKFYGFYPNKNIYDLSIVNLDKSEYRQAEKGKIFHKIVLNSKYPKDAYIFTIFDQPMYCFVTEKFKKAVEEAGLKGFDFSTSQEIKIDGTELA